ncbi:hypothetical protein D3C76_1672950 [compost metagenome]
MSHTVGARTRISGNVEQVLTNAGVLGGRSDDAPDPLGSSLRGDPEIGTLDQFVEQTEERVTARRGT